MAVFYGFSLSFSLSFRPLYLAWPNNVLILTFFEVSHLFQTAHWSPDSADAGHGFGLQERQKY